MTADNSKTVEEPVGLLLAAGRGRRLDGMKQFIAWPTPEGEKPLVVAAFDAIAPFCNEMLVVVGHRAEEVVTELGDRDFHAVAADADVPMFESVRVGLQAARRLSSTSPVLLHLGDHPQVTGATLSSLFQEAEAHPGRAVLPEYRGRGGHPALIPPELIARLVSLDCPKGLRHFWAENPQLCVRFPVDDAGVVADVDTWPAAQARSDSRD